MMLDIVLSFLKRTRALGYSSLKIIQIHFFPKKSFINNESPIDNKQIKGNKKKKKRIKYI